MARRRSGGYVGTSRRSSRGSSGFSINPFVGVKAPDKIWVYQGKGRFAFTKEAKQAAKHAASIMMFGPVIGTWFATNTTYGPAASKKKTTSSSSTRKPRTTTTAPARTRNTTPTSKSSLSDAELKKQLSEAKSSLDNANEQRKRQMEERKSAPTTSAVKTEKPSAPKASGSGAPAEKPFKLATADVEEVSQKIQEAIPAWQALVGGSLGDNPDDSSMLLCNDLSETRRDAFALGLARRIKETGVSTAEGFDLVTPDIIEDEIDQYTGEGSYSPEAVNRKLLSDTLTSALTDNLLGQ